MQTTYVSAHGFAPTRWTIVASAKHDASTVALEALAQLCEAYRKPLYAFIRRQGYSPADADDLTQGFFFRLLDKNYLRAVDPAKGKFRTFLLTSLNNFIRNEWAYARRQKRGGKHAILSLDAADADGRFAAEPSENVTPAKIFDRRWAETLLERVMSRLEHESTHPAALFKALTPFLTRDEDAADYKNLAVRFDMAPVALRVTVHRLRERWRKILREEVSQTLGPAENVDEEIRYLITALS